MCNLQMSWDSVYQIWQNACEEIYEPILSNAGFKTYEFEYIPNVQEKTRNNGSFLGWWKIEDIEQIMQDIPINGIPIDAWRTAHINTAKLLYKNQDNPEALALIWIGAFLIRYDKNSRCMDSLLKKLRYSYLEELEYIVLNKMKELELEIWSASTKYPVPDCLLDSNYLESIFTPTNTEELVGLIALETAFLRTRWQLADIRLV